MPQPYTKYGIIFVVVFLLSTLLEGASTMLTPDNCRKSKKYAATCNRCQGQKLNVVFNKCIPLSTHGKKIDCHKWKKTSKLFSLADDFVKACETCQAENSGVDFTATCPPGNLQNRTDPLDFLERCLGNNVELISNRSDPLAYSVQRSGQRARVNRAPLAILMAKDFNQVKRAVYCAREARVPPVPRCGGHSYEGFSALDGGLVIDLSALDKVTVYERNGEVLAEVEGGARLGIIYTKLWEQGNYTFNAGTCPSVGIGGHVSGGGYGMQARMYGLAADRVVAMKVILYNGKMITVTATKNADLFWALKGGAAGSFGIVTHFYLKIFKMPVNSFALFSFNTTPQVFDLWQNYFPVKASRRMSSQLTVNGTLANLRVHYIGTPTEMESELAASGILALTPAVPVIRNADCSGLGARLFFWKDTTCTNFKLLDVPRRFSEGDKEFRKSKSEFVTDALLPKTALDMIVQSLQAAPNKNNWIQLEAWGGAIADYPHSAFPVRSQTAFSLQYTAYLNRSEPENSPSYVWIRDLEVKLKPYVSGFHFQNYPDLDLANYGEGYYGKTNFDRLKIIKSIYDPENIFHNSQSIPLI